MALVRRPSKVPPFSCGRKGEPKALPKPKSQLHGMSAGAVRKGSGLGVIDHDPFESLNLQGSRHDSGL